MALPDAAPPARRSAGPAPRRPAESGGKGGGEPPGPLSLDDSVRRLAGIGPKRAAALEGEGLVAIIDLLARRPMRYEERSRFSTLADAAAGQPALLLLSVVSCRLIRTRRRDFTITEAYLRDGSGTLRATWFNRPYLARSMTADRRLVLFGTLGEKGGGAAVENPDYELLDDGDEVEGSPHFGRIVPIHRRLQSLSGKALRSVIFETLRELHGAADPRQQELVGALQRLHFPGSLGEADDALRELGRQEIVEFLVGLGLKRAARVRSSDVPPRLDEPGRQVARLARLAPFPLTAGQRAALSDVLGDLASRHPMARLLHGEVGSGKTIVALLAAIPHLEARRQVALLAPTEVLAQQIREQAERLFGSRSPLGGRTVLLSGSVKGLDRNHALLRIARGEASLVIGTHALFQEKVVFHDLGMVIVDEQQRFGVRERAALLAKASGAREPDLLVMSATPIPRTLTLTLYGDLDLSRIDEAPPGRGTVSTRILSWAERAVGFEALEGAIARGEQGFIVVPRIDEEDPPGDAASPVPRRKLRGGTLERVVAGLREKRPAWRLGVLHGRLDPVQKAKVASDLRAGVLDVVVATTVVEVGVDVPGASVMIVMGADAFGLSQLHQLRGRTGRGGAPGSCFLVLSRDATGEAKERVALMESLTDGFRVAEADWLRRGPGELGGGRQWGAVGFRFADLALLEGTIGETRAEAEAICVRLSPGEAAERLRRWERTFATAGVA